MISSPTGPLLPLSLSSGFMANCPADSSRGSELLLFLHRTLFSGVGVVPITFKQFFGA